MLQMKPDKEAFEQVCKELESGEQLNCKHVINVFGWPAMELYLLVACQNKELVNILDEMRRKV